MRWGGTGPAVVLIHGYAENSDSWAALAADLLKDHTVVVPLTFAELWEVIEALNLGMTRRAAGPRHDARGRDCVGI